ncbi:class I SAM-dependent methyltransferase [Actomonas aquatica]|uniref:Class I SAM-dependent methyltransferase n=1 Tax=Actomonas aquatica TaxID=2866162 RepID=A0ABZ1CGR2_9BACT|nr:class I SAM-dependent methyltransferase [Opitutus sp. WL0086]WRQ89460.1 class I SAM-dependent methyltransferase [Opitutus sp. WL0086]
MVKKISFKQVREDFNDLRAVVHYTRAAHKLGLWASELAVFEKYLPPAPDAPILEAGCGAGRVSMALYESGRRNLTAFDFAEELCAMAQSLFLERETGDAITLFHADARKVATHPQVADQKFAAVLFMFNGLMQIPRRRNRRAAMRSLRALAAPGAPFIFTTHDRDHSPHERKAWWYEAKQWAAGKQDPCLVEYGDRYFEDDLGRTFMHLPDREEILADLKATGWTHTWDAMRREIAKESRAVRDFSDENRFWVAHA